MIDGRSLVAVALFAAASHATALGGGYIWLDHAHLEQGLALAPPERFAALFTHGFAGTGFYRPLVALSLSLDALVQHGAGDERPRVPAALQNLGVVRFSDKRYAAARRAWTAALGLAGDPEDRRQLEHNLAVLALETGASADAARLLQSETERHDARPEALFVRARALHELGRDAEASALLTRLRAAAAAP